MYGAKPDLGVQVLGEMMMKRAFEDGAALNQRSVLCFQVAFAHDDPDTLSVELRTTLS